MISPFLVETFALISEIPANKPRLTLPLWSVISRTSGMTPLPERVRMIVIYISGMGSPLAPSAANQYFPSSCFRYRSTKFEVFSPKLMLIVWVLAKFYSFPLYFFTFDYTVMFTELT